MDRRATRSERLTAIWGAAAGSFALLASLVGGFLTWILAPISNAFVAAIELFFLVVGVVGVMLLDLRRRGLLLKPLAQMPRVYRTTSWMLIVGLSGVATLAAISVSDIDLLIGIEAMLAGMAIGLLSIAMGGEGRR